MRKLINTNITNISKLDFSEIQRGATPSAEVKELYKFINEASEPDLKYLLFRDKNNKSDRDKICRKLALIISPDKYPLVSSQQKQQLGHALSRIFEVKGRIDIEEQNLRDELLFQELGKKLSSIGTINPDDDNFTLMSKLEHDMYVTLIANGSMLSDQTHQSLVYSYCKVLQYLIFWGAENKEEWLASNMSLLSDHCVRLSKNIERARAVELFEIVLRVNVKVEKAGLVLIGEQIEKDNQRKNLESINKHVNIIGATASIGITAALTLSGPGGWFLLLAAAASAATTVGQAYVTDKRGEIKNKDRANLYEKMLLNSKKEATNIFSAVKREIEYFKYKEKTRRTSKVIENELKDGLLMQRSMLLQMRRTLEEDVILEEIEQCLYEEHCYFTENEKTQLGKFGINVEEVYSLEEANNIRREFLENGVLSEEDFESLCILGEEQKLLQSSEKQLLLTDKPSATLFGSNKNSDFNKNTSFETHGYKHH